MTHPIPSDNLAPVCLFVYNRPWHTKEVLDCLSRAKLAESSTLYIFCDGPKETATGEELDKIRKVQSLARSEKRFRQVTVVAAENNIGLGKSIIRGINHVLENHDTIIVMEDDLLAHPDFLVFMNYYLNIYKNSSKVMHISGFQRNSYLQFFLPRIYFTRFMNCSGWATWSDRWRLLITEIEVFDNYLSIPENREKFDFGTLQHSAQFDLNRDGLRTWAIFWYATISFLNGICLNPRFSYIKNIGNDGSGANNVYDTSDTYSNYTWKFKKYHGRPVESRLGEMYIRDAYSKRSRKRFNRVKESIFKMLTRTRSLFLGVQQW